MTTQNPVRTDQLPTPARAQVAEYKAWSTHGIKVLTAGIVGLLAAAALGWYAGKQTGDTDPALAWAAAVVLIAAVLLLVGLTSVVPGQARGLQWVNPFTRRIKVSTRIRNLETAQAKVNDADGNPIEIAAVVVWEVQDTAKAIYAVDEYTKFVAIQTETAVRHVASSYPYTSHTEGELSLRENVAEITGQLSAEIADRVRSAGVAIIESRLTRLSYAAEIAQAMLRQQQASAVVAARHRIVEGAVGMVQMALKRLEEENVVQLDEERKAAMVSNLLVVLCSEQATQQVVNTGSLY
jgi:hypothetical protein